MTQVEDPIGVPMKNMEQLPEVTLTVDVASDVINSYIHSRSEDARIKSTSERLHGVNSMGSKDGQLELSVKNIDQETIEETMISHEWYGRIYVRYRYSIHPLDTTSSKISIATQYQFPWLLRSLISWPIGSATRLFIAVSVESLVSELVALEVGRKSA